MRVYKLLILSALIITAGISCKKSKIIEPEVFDVRGIEYEVYDYYYYTRTDDKDEAVNYKTKDTLLSTGKYNVITFDSAYTYTIQNGGSGTWSQNGTNIILSTAGANEKYFLDGNKLKYNRSGNDENGNYFFERIYYSVIREFDGTIE